MPAGQVFFLLPLFSYFMITDISACVHVLQVYSGATYTVWVCFHWNPDNMKHETCEPSAPQFLTRLLSWSWHNMICTISRYMHQTCKQNSRANSSQDHMSRSWQEHYHDDYRLDCAFFRSVKVWVTLVCNNTSDIQTPGERTDSWFPWTQERILPAQLRGSCIWSLIGEQHSSLAWWLHQKLHQPLDPHELTILAWSATRSHESPQSISSSFMPPYFDTFLQSLHLFYR